MEGFLSRVVGRGTGIGVGEDGFECGQNVVDILVACILTPLVLVEHNGLITASPASLVMVIIAAFSEFITSDTSMVRPRE